MLSLSVNPSFHPQSREKAAAFAAAARWREGVRVCPDGETERTGLGVPNRLSVRLTPLLAREHADAADDDPGDEARDVTRKARAHQEEAEGDGGADAAEDDALSTNAARGRRI